MKKQTIKKALAVAGVVILILLVDQIVKIWIKTHMTLGDSIDVTGWFKIHFIENNGMAFGIEAIGKTFLSLFRVVAVFVIIFYIKKLIEQNYKTGFIICIAMILAGASGNIIDSLFYGSIFTESYPGHVASLVPFGEGYASFLHGKVVDMFYFPLVDTTFPDWVPIWGGNDLQFFRYVFNIADASISVGVCILLIFYRKTLSLSLASKAGNDKKSQVSDSEESK